jgi:hypothetical protein
VSKDKMKIKDMYDKYSGRCFIMCKKDSDIPEELLNIIFNRIIKRDDISKISKYFHPLVGRLNVFSFKFFR